MKSSLGQQPKILIGVLGNIALLEGNVYRMEHFAAVLNDAGFCVRFAAFVLPSSQPRVQGWFCRGNGLWGILKAFLSILIRIALWRPDVLILSHLGSPFLGMISYVARAFHCSVVFDSQDWPLHSVRDLYGSSPLLAPLLVVTRLSLRVVDRMACATLVVSNGLADALRNDGWAGPLIVVPNIHSTRNESTSGSPVFRSIPGWDGALAIVYTGGLQRQIRGLEIQMMAAAMARASGVDVRIIMLGAGDEVYFRQLARDIGIQESVIILGAQTHDRVIKAIEEADLAILEPTPYILPSKSFEYIQRGLYVIASSACRDVHDAFNGLVREFDGTPEDLCRVFVSTTLEPLRRSRDDRRAAGSRLVSQLRSETEHNVIQLIANIAAERAETTGPNAREKSDRWPPSRTIL